MRNEKNTIILFLLFCFAETVRCQEALAPAMRNQFYLELESGLHLGYVWHIQDSDLGFGLGLGVHSFSNHTFNHSDFSSSGMNFFVRYQLKKFLQIDGGMEFLSGLEDEDGDRRAGFFGLKFSDLAGYKYVFLGPTVRTGFSRSEFGAAYSLTFRFVIPGKK
jgi:hypothetical protein